MVKSMNCLSRTAVPLSLVLALISLPLLADESTHTAADSEMCGLGISADFIESAPRDLFRFNNRSSAQWDIETITLDLSTSAGNLLFDITSEGAGVEVFQPFKGEASSAALAQQPQVTDGDQVIALSFEQFSSTNSYTFSIDVDDQLSNSELGQIRVSGSEIQGGTVSFAVSTPQGVTLQISGKFDKDNRIRIQHDNCQ